MNLLGRRSFLQLLTIAMPSSLFAKVHQTSSADKKQQGPPSVSPVRAGEDRYDFNRNIPNGTTTFKVSTKDCSGDFFAMEHHHTKKGGPPRHRHSVEDEWFYVIEGEYLVEVGGKPYHLKAGDSILGPRNIPHAFAFAGESTGRLLITYAPAGRMEEFFDVRDKVPGGRSSFVLDQQQMRAYGMELTGPPLSVT